jgi:putative tricarboxylic transport membrane protein
MLGRDGTAGLVVLVGCVTLFALTLGLAENPLVPIGPGFYPRLVLGVTAALALALIVTDVLAPTRRRDATPASAQRPNYRLVVIQFVVFAAYVAALPYLGFRASTFLFVLGAQATLAPPRDARRWIMLTVVALVTTAATYAVFELYLHVLLPRGRWTGF